MSSAVARGRSRCLAVIVVAALAGLVAAPTGWFVVEALEQDDDFCVACHLSQGQPLHFEVRRDFDVEPPVDLAGVHGGALLAAERGGEGRGDEGDAFRCIDCHGGTGLMGRARVKALAARDTFWYLTGAFEEPDGMQWPLEEADCRKCHAAFALKASALESPAFHDTILHNQGLGVGCVECHLAHAPGDASNYFLDPQRTRAQCALCHREFGD